MSKGICPKCNSENEYSKVICDFCGARLPWADALKAAAVSPSVQATPTLEAQAENDRNEFYRRSNENLKMAEANAKFGRGCLKVYCCFLPLGFIIFVLVLGLIGTVWDALAGK